MEAFREISLTQRVVALIDLEDYADISQFKWCATKGRDGRFYAVRNMWTGSKQVKELMHRRIMQAPQGLQVDHVRSHDTLDNRKSNLRLATGQQNMWNRKMHCNNTSGYRGVAWSKPAGKFVAQIQVNGRLQYLGLFRDPEVAARAYDQAALRWFGEFAQLNFPLQ